MVQPINYGAVLAPTSPLDPDAFMRGAQGGQVLVQNMQNRQIAQAQAEQAQAQAMKAQTDARLAIEAAQAKAQADAERKAALAKLSQPGTPLAEFGRVAVIYPEISEQIKRSQDMLTDAEKQTKFTVGARALSALETGNGEAAAALLEEEAARNEASGRNEDARSYRLNAEAIRKAPEQARAVLATYLAGADPQNFAKIEADIRANPATVEKIEADAGKATVQALAEGQVIDAEIGLKRAQAAKYRADIAIDARRMNLDEKKAQADWNKMMMEAAQAGAGAPLETDERKAVSEAAKEAVVLNGSADATEALAAKMAGAANRGESSGIRGGLVRKWETFIGNESEMTQLRNEANQFITKGVVDSLPAGAASENDVSMVKAGFPGENADTAYVAKWLKAYANVKRSAAKVKRAESIWTSANQGGGLGPARRAFTLDGKQVNPGDSFVDFVAPPKAASKFSQPRR
jgi:hypothetical protein